MKEVQIKPFGKTKKKQLIQNYVLENEVGDQVTLSEYGATLIRFKTMRKNGEAVDIVLGYETLGEYETNGGNLGATCGRFANRIQFGEFRLNDTFYRIPKKDELHVCHSGETGFHTRVWTCQEATDDSVVFQYVAPDGEGGFPGELTTTVRYSFDDNRTLTIHYEAQTTKDTVINLTNHTYFNLNGEGEIDKHYIELNSDFYTPFDSELIPTGEIVSVDKTGFDLRSVKELAEVFASSEEAIRAVDGLDQNFIVNREVRGELCYAGRLLDPEQKIQLACFTTEPGMQVYSANMLDDLPGSGNRKFGKHTGICFETQNFPNSPNVTYFPSPVLRVGEVFQSTTIYTFRDEN